MRRQDRLVATRALICLIVLSVTSAFAENGQAILPYDSPVTEDLKSIYLENGKTPLSSAGPYSFLLGLEKVKLIFLDILSHGVIRSKL